MPPLSLIFALCLSVGLLGCSSQRGQQRAAEIAVPKAFVSPTPAGQDPGPARWWQAFGDSTLNRLIDEAFSSSWQLQIAWARLRQAEASLTQAKATWFPSLTLGPDVSGSRRVFRGPFGPGGQNVDVVLEQILYSASMGASYEIDLWGKLSEQRKAAGAQLLATRDQLDAAAITVAAQITDTWFNLLAQRAQYALLQTQRQTSKELLEVLKLQFQQGMAPSFDVLAQGQQVSALDAQMALVKAQEQVLSRQLSILVGHDVQAIVNGGLAARLPSLPPLPATGLPADLVTRRPDVRAAQRMVLAADHRLGSALATRFPALVLNGSIGFSATSLSRIFDNIVWSFLVGLTQSVFDGGRRGAQIDQARAVVDEQVAVYGDALRRALVEVETSLVQEHFNDEHITHLQAQAEQAEQALAQARNSYVQGLTGYLSVLNALRSQQAIEQTLLAAERQRLSNRVALYRALGGTWTKELKPSNKTNNAAKSKAFSESQRTPS